MLPQHDLCLPARLVAYRGTPLYDHLQGIHETLQRHRGFDTFVKRQRLPRVDYFLPTRRVIVEFDESQHFTVPRVLTLRAYPSEVPLGYDRQRWIALCNQLHRNDKLPPYRDEQRAWFDTLRDFSPNLLGNRPTVRLYAGQMKWCALRLDREEDIRRFEDACSVGTTPFR